MLSSNSSLIQALVSRKILKSHTVEKAMLSVDRANYVTQELKYMAYDDRPLALGYGQTISAPHMHAEALERLHEYIVRPGAQILDVGCGSGYLTACIGRMLQQQNSKEGRVVGIEIVEDLVERATKNIKADASDLLEEKTVIVKKGNAWEGEVEFGPFDAIHVGAAAETLPPKLVDALKPNGRMIIPIGKTDQALYQIDKDLQGRVSQTHLMGVRYVPLVKDL